MLPERQKTKIQLCQYHRKCNSGHHEQDAQCNRSIGQQFQLNNKNFTMDGSKAKQE
jgi:hypothetical protein